jgi:predicted  nucleic acid-binding Zn-ribbon protein
MPHWTCDRCGARLYSASESLKWQDCPVCTGNLARRPEDPRRFDRPHEREARLTQRKRAR